jgi:hypothetical protein
VNDQATDPRTLRAASGTIFWLVLVLLGYFVPRGMQSNPDSHLVLAYALVEHHTVQITAYQAPLFDKAVYCGRHTNTRTCATYYSDKAPDAGLLAAAVYLVLHPLLPASLMPANPWTDRYLLRWLLTLLVVGVISAACAVSFFRFTARFVAARWAALITIAYAIGGMALPFGILYFSHNITAALLFWAFLLLSGARRPGSGDAAPFVAGLLAGYAIGGEYPAALIALLLGLYTLLDDFPARAAIRRGIGYAAGGAVGLIPLLIYDRLAFGNPLGLGYGHLVQGYYVKGMARGIFGVGLPTWDGIWGTSFSPYRGIFLLSPWLLLAAPGLVLMSRRGLRREALLCGAIVIVYFLFNAGYYFWDGGASTGPRQFIPALPFFALPVVFAVERPGLRRLGIVLVAIAVIELLLVVVTNPLYGDPLYQGNVWHPFVDQTLHDLATVRLENNWGMVLGLPGYLSLLPLLLIEGLLARRLLRAVTVAPRAESRESL